MYQLTPIARHSSKMVHFVSQDPGLLSVSDTTLACIGAFFHSSPKKSVHQVVPSEIVCRMYVIQLLLTLSFPPAQHTNFFVVGLTIFKCNGM